MLVPARGFEFEVDTGGPDDGPAVLLLHGFPQNAAQWGAVIPALNAAGLRTFAPNQRGYSPGARPADVKDYALVECIADAVSIMDGFAIEKFHVVAHDWGAAVAWGVTATHPDRVLSLTSFSVGHPSALSAALADPETGQRERFAYMAYFADVDRAAARMLADDGEQFRLLFLGSGLSHEGIDAYLAPMRDPEALKAALKWYTATFAYPAPRFDRVTVPTTLVWSNGDLAMGPEQARTCGDYVDADYRYIELDGVSHWISDQVPDVAAKAIIERVTAKA